MSLSEAFSYKVNKNLPNIGMKKRGKAKTKINFWQRTSFVKFIKGNSLLFGR